MDADDKAGLKHKYELRILTGEAKDLLKDGKADEARTALDKALRGIRNHG